jgi:hypothetical protein
MARYWWSIGWKALDEILGEARWPDARPASRLELFVDPAYRERQAPVGFDNALPCGPQQGPAEGERSYSMTR